MAIVKEPAPRPSDLSYVPSGSKPYRVTNGDSSWTLADRPEVKASGMTALDLCFFNFKTRKPAEINWYLYHKVGTRVQTRDGNNYMFATSDSPGIVYLPKPGPPPPVNDIPPKLERLDTWVGLGAKALGTQFVIVGIETMAGWAFSLDDPGKGMALTATINRAGPGVGVSGGASLIYVTGVSSPGQLDGFQQGEWDFNLSIGGRWDKVAKSAATLKKLKPLIDIIKATGAKTPKALKEFLKAHPDKWVEMVKTGRSLKGVLGAGDTPNVMIIDIPFAGAGVEASVFFGVANFNAVYDNY